MPLPLFFGLAAAVSFAMGALPLLGLPCETCGGGALSVVLPWTGAAVYGPLAVLAARRPASPLLGSATAFVVFVHAELLAESVFFRRRCWGCMAVGALAFAAAVQRFARHRPDGPALATSLVLGVAASFFGPADRVDYALTRAVWPTRLLRDLPAIVDAGEVFTCDHGAPVRLLLFEKDCKG